MKPQNEIIKFAEEYAFAFNPYKNEYQKINLFDYQKNMLKSFEKNNFSIIKQSRQVGVDTAVAVYIAYFLLKNQNKQTLVISNNTDCAIKFLEKVKTILLYAKEIPERMNQKSIYLKNGSKITVTGSSADAGRGFRCDLIYMNNFEYINNSSNIYKAIQPTIYYAGGKLILSSTPKYKKDFFYNIWTSAAKKESSFKRINVSWKENPYFDEEWYKKECLVFGNPDSITTELDGKFIVKKDKNRKAAINIRLSQDKKYEILKKMRQKNISSITDYIMELIDKDLE